MEPVIVSWLLLTCSCSLPILLLLSSLFIYHSYRNHWSTVHVFIVCLTSVELFSCFLLFAYSLLFLLLRTSFPTSVCLFFIWSFVSVRLLQVLILASMCVDRVLYSQSLHRYRVSANQVRYHVVFLLLLCTCIGLAGIFSRFSQPFPSTTSTDTCIVLSIQWPFPFAILFVVILTLSFSSHLVCALLLCIYKLSSRYASITRPLNQCSVVFATSLSCYAVHHLPYLIITVFILFVLPISTPWLENGFAWLSFADSLFLPVVLVLADKTHWEALKKTFRRPTLIRHSLAESCDTFQYLNELSEAKVFPRRLFDSTFASKSTFKVCNGVKEDPFVWPIVCPGNSLNEIVLSPPRDNIIMQPVYSINALRNRSSTDVHLGMSNGNNLFVDYSDEDDDDTSSVCGSVAANEDFEFHNVRRMPLPIIDDRTYQISDKNRANSDTWTRSRNRLSLSLNDLDQLDLDVKVNDAQNDFKRNLYVQLSEAYSESKLNENEKTLSLSSRRNLNREEYKKIASKIDENFVITQFDADGDHLKKSNQLDYKKVFITKYL